MLCPSDPAPALNKVTVAGTDYFYGGNNYMISTGSGTSTHYDQRWSTDGITFENSMVGFNAVIDGASNTVFVSESIRSTAMTSPCRLEKPPSFPTNVL